MAASNCIKRRARLCDLHRLQHGRCFYCRSFFLGSGDLTIDHLVPRSQGGSDHPGNLVLCCSSCNNQFGDIGLKFKLVWMLQQLKITKV